MMQCSLNSKTYSLAVRGKMPNPSTVFACRSNLSWGYGRPLTFGQPFDSDYLCVRTFAFL